MIFTSLEYAAFLALVALVHWLLPPRFRPALLLVASYAFYLTWSVPATGILAATSLVVFLATPAIARAEGRQRAVLTGLTVAVSASSMLILKTVAALGLTESGGGIAVPVGLSFFSFQAISYVVDVHRKVVRPRRSILDVFLYLAFFPHLLAGPIVRAKKLIPAFHHTDRWPDRVRTAEAAELLLTGTFKKVVVADPILALAGTVLDHPSRASGVDLAVALAAALVAAYFDVTGYIDIARGSAKLLGIDMQRNSLLPLTRSTGYADFWRRWQLTIMAWFRDYLYQPIRGAQREGGREYVALFATFFLLGVWHGLTPGWALWGIASGAIITVERIHLSRRAARRRAQRRLARSRRDRSLLPKDPSPILGLAVTMVLVLATLPLIATDTLAKAASVYGGILTLRSGHLDTELLWYLGLALVALVVVDAREARREARAGRRDPVTIRRAVAFGIYVVAIIVSSGPAPQSFIYFAF
ncbi:MAG: MBOAT family O-acyltransferase [Acidimicrobiales bacterium]